MKAVRQVAVAVGEAGQPDAPTHGADGSHLRVLIEVVVDANPRHQATPLSFAANLASISY